MIQPAQWRALGLLGGAAFFGMSVWFSASAAVPAIKLDWQLSDSGAVWLTLSIQLGFIVGTLLSALFNLPDVIKTRRLFALSATLSAATNAAFALFAQGATSGIALRFFTGLFVAGVYPPGMKLMATWFRQGRGMAIGFLVGALTLGKATPYLINAFGSASWQRNMLIISGFALLGGLIVLLFVSDGPFTQGNAPFDLSQVKKILANRGVRLSNFGYFGHMWELYAMWTWTPVMLRASFTAQGRSPILAEAGSFLVIGAGAAGCIIAGIIADRVGRTIVTSAAMAISGGCCLIIGFLFEANPFWLLLVAAIWGATVVADSAQFSTCVTELGDPQYIGTALTLQTCLGFLLTMFSIELIQALVGTVGWRYAFIALAPGPFLGVLAMLRLRQLPEAVKIAQGRK